MLTTAGRARAGRPGGGGPRDRLLEGVPVTERRLPLAGVDTALLEGGDGPPLILLHGPGAYAASWQAVIPGLLETHRVVAPDLPGHGASAPARGGPDRVLSWLGELIGQTCATRPVIVGQLVGGAIAARFAADHADRLEGLVLVVPLGLAPFQPAPAFAAALDGFLAEPDERTHDELWRRCVHDLDDLRRRPEARWEPMRAYTLDRARTPGGADGLRDLMGQFGLAPIPDAALRRIRVPVTLVWGRHDPIVPLAVGQAASVRHGWPLHVIERAGNEPAIERPQAFLRVLRAVVGEGGQR